eukprot:TRINITY_DN1015_c2_g1_i1.p1 TRINITY_DN1015_c2_g1~~TRINITY_DN1015_c2_g1_i1.p1  ORF type:complete len:435 (+),score=114.36 TRINITY_DN1015_c2_g1_i1:88-1305(+)
MEGLWATVQSNPYFHAGAGLYGLGAVAMTGRVAMRGVKEYTRRRYLASVEMTNRDPGYRWVMEWLANHKGQSYGHRSLQTSGVVVHANNSISADLKYVPSPGVHYFMHKGAFFWINRTRQLEKTMGTDVLETLQLTTFSLHWNTLQGVLEEAASEASYQDRDKTIIYTCSGTKWVRFHDPRAKKPLGSVILPDGKKGKMMDDIHSFLESRDWYERMGIPYRRGYLLHGPPGCGKSSFVMALAGELDMAICILSLSTRNLDDEGLIMLLNTAPQRSILLLEDVDRAFSAESRVTVSGVLNSIDGVAAQEGRLLFLTTNHIDKLDDALIRPGRCDVRLLFPNATESQQHDMFLRFFPGEEAHAQDFVREIRLGHKTPPSMATLQGHLFSYRDSAAEAVEALRGYSLE